MTRIKICGITNIEDARAAIDYGAHALGYILIPESPRFISSEDKQWQLLAEIPPLVSCIAVCRNPTEVSHRFDNLLNSIQFYETQVEQTWQWVSGELKLIYAYPMRGAGSLDEVESALKSMSRVNGECLVSTLLLDAYHPDKLGGCGETFDWELAREAKERFGKPIILAGGLTPENVGDAIASVRPYAVDVSSGVEAEPGRKDHAKLKAFIDAVRKADARL